MKLVLGLLVFAFAVSLTVALPVEDLNDDAEVIVVPLEKQKGRRIPSEIDPGYDDFHGVIETDGYPFFSLAPINPFNWNLGFFDSFEDIYRRLREQIASAWSNIPDAEDCDDPAKCNTTSTVKIVGDHKVVINETVYNNSAGNAHSIHRIRVISVQPLETNEQPEGSVSSIEPAGNTDEDKGSPEVLETNAKDNEVLGNIDSKESTEFIVHEGNNKHSRIDLESGHHAEFTDEMQSFENKGQNQQVQSQHDAIKEEFLMHDAHQSHQEQRKQNPESFNGEFSDEFDVSSYEASQAHPNNEWESFDENDDTQYNVSNENKDVDIDTYEAVPIDLSNDIAVNQILADRGTPLNKDAEVLTAEDLLKLQGDAMVSSTESFENLQRKQIPSQSLKASNLQPIK